MKIIKYLVLTVSYDIDELSNDTYFINDSYKAYGALVNHKAVCSGYAKAFDLMAKMCGLLTTVVTGEAINSANQLFNNYINCTDAEFSINHIREIGHSCTATKCGKNVVAYYLSTGIVDLNANVDLLRKQYEQEIAMYSLANDENGKNLRLINCV